MGKGDFLILNFPKNDFRENWARRSKIWAQKSVNALKIGYNILYSIMTTLE